MISYYPRPIMRKPKNVNGRKTFRETIRQSAEDITLNWVIYVERAKYDKLKKEELLSRIYLHIKTSSDQETFQLIPQEAIFGITRGLEGISPDHSKAIRTQYLNKRWELNLK